MNLVRGNVLLGRETIPVDTPGPFTHSSGDPAFGDLTIVAWDDGSWSWDGVTVDARSRALVPVDDGIFMGSIQTMRHLKPSEYPLAQPYRLRIVTATQTTKIEDYVNGKSDAPGRAGGGGRMGE